jgi:hypothetical protein
MSRQCPDRCARPRKMAASRGLARPPGRSMPPDQSPPGAWPARARCFGPSPGPPRRGARHRLHATGNGGNTSVRERGRPFQVCPADPAEPTSPRGRSFSARPDGRPERGRREDGPGPGIGQPTLQLPQERPRGLASPARSFEPSPGPPPPPGPPHRGCPGGGGALAQPPGCRDVAINKASLEAVLPPGRGGGACAARRGTPCPVLPPGRGGGRHAVAVHLGERAPSPRARGAAQEQYPAQGPVAPLPRARGAAGPALGLRRARPLSPGAGAASSKDCTSRPSPPLPREQGAAVRRPHGRRTHRPSPPGAGGGPGVGMASVPQPLSPGVAWHCTSAPSPRAQGAADM